MIYTADKTFHTSVGTFYLRGDGFVVDNLDPMLVDLSWDSLEQFLEDTEEQHRIKLSAVKDTVKLELESLIDQCYRELRNIERYDDNRMLVATADLQFHLERVIEASDELETAFDSAIEEEEN